MIFRSLLVLLFFTGVCCFQSESFVREIRDSVSAYNHKCRSELPVAYDSEVFVSLKSGSESKLIQHDTCEGVNGGSFVVQYRHCRAYGAQGSKEFRDVYIENPYYSAFIGLDDGQTSLKSLTPRLQPLAIRDGPFFFNTPISELLSESYVNAVSESKTDSARIVLFECDLNATGNASKYTTIEFRFVHVGGCWLPQSVDAKIGPGNSEDVESRKSVYEWETKDSLPYLACHTQVSQRQDGSEHQTKTTYGPKSSAKNMDSAISYLSAFGMNEPDFRAKAKTWWFGWIMVPPVVLLVGIIALKLSKRRKMEADFDSHDGVNT